MDEWLMESCTKHTKEIVQATHILCFELLINTITDPHRIYFRDLRALEIERDGG